MAVPTEDKVVGSSIDEAALHVERDHISRDAAAILMAGLGPEACGGRRACVAISRSCWPRKPTPVEHRTVTISVQFQDKSTCAERLEYGRYAPALVEDRKAMVPQREFPQTTIKWCKRLPVFAALVALIGSAN